MKIRFAVLDDLDQLSEFDNHISKQELSLSISLKRVLIAEEKGEFLGWLRFSLFWDNTPFMNMLFILEAYRGKGVGRGLVTRWENEMKLLNYRSLMTSTQSNENAQHFYRKLEYRDAGALLLPGEPLEIIFVKEI